MLTKAYIVLDAHGIALISRHAHPEWKASKCFVLRGDKISPHSALLSARSISRPGSLGEGGIKVRDVLRREEGVINSGIVMPASCGTVTFPID